MSDDKEWLYIDASSARLFRLGEAVCAGEKLGSHIHGGLVRAGSNGRVTQIQYDIDTDQIILAIAPTCYSVAA